VTTAVPKIHQSRFKKAKKFIKFRSIRVAKAKKSKAKNNEATPKTSA